MAYYIKESIEGRPIAIVVVRVVVDNFNIDDLVSRHLPLH